MNGSRLSSVTGGPLCLLTREADRAHRRTRSALYTTGPDGLRAHCQRHVCGLFVVPRAFFPCAGYNRLVTAPNEGSIHRLLHLLERAGAQGMTAREVAAVYWPHGAPEKRGRRPCIAGQMLCVLVDRGYASRMGGVRNAVYVLQEGGRNKLAAIAEEQAEQARQNAARGGRAPKFPGDDASEEQGPWF